MSFTINLLHEFYPDDDAEEEVEAVATLGPYTDAYVSGLSVYGDGERVAYADGVNPGMWYEGKLVDVTGFHIKETVMSAATKGDRVEAVWFKLDDGLRIWPIWDNGRPTGQWRVVQVDGEGPDARITEVERGDNGHWLEVKHPGAQWGINDNETVPPGTQGTVASVFESGPLSQVRVVWDNGSTLGLTPQDQFRKL